MNSPGEITEEGGWRPVPPGTFGRIASRSTTRRTRRRVAWAGMAACLAVVAAWSAVGVAYLRLDTPDDGGFEYAGIRCGEVRDLLPDYLAGTLPDGKAAQVRAHVTKCSICTDRIRRAKSGLPIAFARTPVSLPLSLSRAEAALAPEGMRRHPAGR